MKKTLAILLIVTLVAGIMLTATAEASSKKKAKFSAKVSISGPSVAAPGDTVKLNATVSKANQKYKVRWEYRTTGNWTAIRGAKDTECRLTVGKTDGEVYTVRIVLTPKKGKAKSAEKKITVKAPIVIVSNKATIETAAEEILPEEGALAETEAAEPQAEAEGAAEAPAEAAPVEAAPAAEQPAEVKPAEAPTVEAKAIEQTPAEETPAEEAPAEETPAEETPAEETPAEETPAEEIPAEETPAEETPAEETPAEETPAEETPAEEIPAEEIPAEEIPAEETPAVETPTEEDPSEDMPESEEPAGEEPADEETTEEESEEEPGNEQIEDYETPLGLPMENPELGMKVSIFTSRGSTIQVGDAIRLTSKIEGFDGYEIRYQWECDKHDGAGFRDVSGANGSSYSFSASADNLKWDWRLSVYYH